MNGAERADLAALPANLFEALHEEGRMGRTKKPPTQLLPRRSQRRWTVTAADQQILRRRFPQLFAFEDRLRQLQETHDVSPARVRAILTSPYGPLSASRKLQRVQDQLAHYRQILALLDIEMDDTQHPAVEVEIAQLEVKAAELVARCKSAHLGLPKRWSTPPPEPFWTQAPVDIPTERWLGEQPRHWGWLRERAAALAAYLATRLANPQRPWRDHRADTGKKGTGVYGKEVGAVTAELVQLFYRGYFPHLTFTARDVKSAVDHHQLTS